MKKRTMFLLVILLIFSGCQKAEKLQLKDLPIEHENEFGGVYIRMTIDDFNDKGFAYGDSVDVVFSNGHKLEDIPYYNGYYVEAGEPLLVGYPGYEYIKAGINYGSDLWDDFSLKLDKNEATLWQSAGLKEHDTATIILREKGRYLNIQEASDIHYFDEREKYDSDEMFANFRVMDQGYLKKGLFYRSASPCDNQHKRAVYVDKLIEAAGVQTILDLADNDVKIGRYLADSSYSCPYFFSLYTAGNVEALALNMNYLSEEFAQKIVQGLISISRKPGPYLIHCTEGKDRTGFVAMLIEALGGASYAEIRDDYMLTYYNYYRIDEKSDPEKYATILKKNLDAMISHVVGDETVDIQKTDLAVYAKEYLLRAGMAEEELNGFLKQIRE